MLRPVLFLLSALLPLAPSPSFAQFGSTREERAACRPDAFRLCRASMPNLTATKNCVLANKARLSPACRAVVERKT